MENKIINLIGAIVTCVATYFVMNLILGANDVESFLGGTDSLLRELCYEYPR
jgi:hypothetical protein